MAKTIITTLVDDIDGSPADSTTTFALDGVSYEIDLSAENKTKLEKALADYLKAGRRIGVTRRAGRPRGKSDSVAIRAWAQDRGIAISTRGRIPASVVAQYEQSH